MTDRDVLAKIKASVLGLTEEPKLARPRRITARTTPDKVLTVLSGLKDAGCRHLSAISTVDTGDAFEVIYHVSAGGVLVSLRTSVPKAAPRVPTATGVFPVAVLYEREAHDLMGIEFEGHPDPRPLLLYEGWPEGQYPLRKDWKPPTGGEKHA